MFSKAIESLRTETGNTLFSTQQIARKAESLYLKGELPECNADKPYFFTNYVASALYNLEKAQKPQVYSEWSFRGKKRIKIWGLKL